MTDNIEDGGPAFPTEPNTQPGFYLHHGMSLRDYFAAHAPKPPSSWETGKYPPSPEYPAVSISLSEAAYLKACEAAHAEYEKRLEEYRERVNEWTINREVTWRVAYSDAILAARKASA